MSKFESAPYDLDKVLSKEEIVNFAEEVIWPAVDHIFGMDFRAAAQKAKRPKSLQEFKAPQNEFVTERIIIDAYCSNARDVMDDKSGQRIKTCEVTITVNEMRPEWKDGAVKVLEADMEADDEEAEYYDNWWQDEETDWGIWEGRTFHFSTDASRPLFTNQFIEAQDSEEQDPNERFLWAFDDESNFLPMEEVAIEGISKYKRKRIIRERERVDGIIADKEHELSLMLTWRDCLELTSALMRFGVPADVLRIGE